MSARIDNLIAQAEAAAPAAAPNVDDLIAQAEGNAAPSVDSLIAQAEASQPAAPQQQDLLGAAYKGFRENITGRAVNNLSPVGLIYRAATGKDLLPDNNFEPTTIGEKAAYFGANLVADPAAIITGNAATGAALKATGLASKAERLARLSASTRVLPQAQGLIRSIGTKAGAVGGAAAGGGVMAAESALSAVEDGEIDPISAAVKVGTGLLGGGVAGGVIGRIGAGSAIRTDKVRKGVQDAYENNVQMSKQLDNINLTQGTEAQEFGTDYKFQPLEVTDVNGKTFYHGTKAPINALSEADPAQFSNVKSIYGEGTYLTDDPAVARGYAKTRGKGPEGKVFAGKIGNVNLIDLDKPLPEPALKVINSVLEAHTGRRLSSQAKGKLAYEIMREAFTENGLPESEVVEIYQFLNAELIDAGFNGLKHIGGDKVGKSPHNVAILFGDPSTGIKSAITDAAAPKGRAALFGEEFAAQVAKNRREMLALESKISTVESAHQGALARAGSAKSAEESAKWQATAASHMAENARLQNEFNDRFGGEAYKTLMRVKRAYGDTTIKIGDKEVKAFDFAISRHGVVVDPETAKVFRATKDVAPRMGGAFSTKDPIRLFVEAEGLAGPRQRVFMDGLTKGGENMQAEFGTWSTGMEKHFKAAGIKRFTWTDYLPGSGGMKSRESAKQVFDFLEGKVKKELLTPAQQTLASHIQVHYENTLNRMNQVRLANNVTPIKKRSNYVSHLSELSSAARHGIDLGTSEVITADPSRAGKIGMRFEKERINSKTSKDVYEAVSSYTSSALRTIHLTQPRNQALALAEMMDNAPNLQKGLTTFLNDSVFGGLGSVDSYLISNGAGIVGSFLDGFGKQIGRGTVPGNLKIMFEQLSQTLPTMAITGPKYGAEGVAAMLSGISPQLRAMSRVLTQRGLAEEAGQQLGRSARNVVGQSINGVEGWSRRAMEYVDLKVVEFSWASAFKQAKSAYQLTDKAAALYADDVARSLHGIYQDMYRPALLRNKSIKGAWPFQTFSFNMWNALTTDAKARGALKGTSWLREGAKLVASMEATNFIYQASGLPSPFNLGVLDLASWKPASDDAGTALPPSGVPPVGGYEFTGNSSIPSIGPLGVVTRLPMVASKGAEGLVAMRAAYDLAYNDDKDLDERYADFIEKTARFGKNFVSHGQQIYKTAKGIEAKRQGYVKIGRDEVALGPEDTLSALAFGPENTPSAAKARKTR